VQEEWIEVPGYEDSYAVSNMGRVVSYIKDPSGRLMNPGLVSNKRYLGVELLHKPFLVHELVALAFLGPRPEGYDVNHLDDVKTHNCVSNLEYSTRARNNAQVSAHRILQRGGVRVARWRCKLCGRSFQPPTEDVDGVQVLPLNASMIPAEYGFLLCDGHESSGPTNLYWKP
jgi:hypothetical protein